MTRNRNYDAEALGNAEREYSYEVDALVRGYLLERFHPFLRSNDLSLEVGAHEGDMTRQILDLLASVDVLEASKEMCRRLEQRFGPEVRITHGTLETTNLEHQYLNIFLVHTLEHLEDPVEGLRALGALLSKDGHALIAVPNGQALSRQIAVEMGLIRNQTAVTEGERLQGHQRTYTLDTLLADVRAAGLVPIQFGGVLVKPMANFQIDRALREEIISRRFLDACDSLARAYPTMSSSIYAICQPDD